MPLLQPEPHVPHVVTARIAGDEGQAIVCMPEGESAALVMLERDHLSLHATFGEAGLRRFAAALLEAADLAATSIVVAGTTSGESA